MERKLTKYFSSYKIAKYQKENKVSLSDLLDFGDIDLNKLITLIQLGNPDRISQGHKFPMTEEEAAEILDRYIEAEEDNGIISAYLTLIKEFDMDKRLFRSFGVSVDDLENKLKADIEKSKLANINKEAEQE